MNQIVNKFLWAGVFISCLKCIKKNMDLLILLLAIFPKLNKEFKNLCKQEIQIIFTKMNWIKLV